MCAALRSGFHGSATRADDCCRRRRFSWCPTVGQRVWVCTDGSGGERWAATLQGKPVETAGRWQAVSSESPKRAEWVWWWELAPRRE